MAKTGREGLPGSKTRSVFHYQQRSHWDCGVSCVLMAVDKATRDEILGNMQRILHEEGFGNSTWTIDLCYLLLRAVPKIPLHYTTITIGVDPGYANQAFYNHIIKKDTNRVTERFQNASQNGIKVEKKSIDIVEIIKHIAHRGVVIVLTDANLLKCETCKYYSMACINLENNCLRMCGAGKKSSYQGHFILAVGYDLKTERIMYRNPSVSDRECQINFKDFEEARTAYGTDEDIIFVDNETQLAKV